MDKKTDEESKPFVGFCRIEIVDTDGLGKHVNGAHYQVPIHKVDSSNGDINFYAWFPPVDPVRLLRLSNDDKELITAVWWHGSPAKINDPVPEGKVLAVLESCYSKKKLAESKNGEAPRVGKVFEAKAFCEFVPDCYEKPLDVEFMIEEAKFQTRVTKIGLRMSKEMFENWNSYYNTLKEFDKEKKDKDENNKNGDKDPKEKE